MAVSSEATVGHIIGFLRLDADQYFRELEKAQVAADSLGKRKVDVKATAKTGAARSELAALGNAVDRVDGAQKRATASSNKLGAAHQRNGRHMRALVVTALALGPALGPLAGTTIGLAGALTSMGAAGVVAILGVKREIEQGTTLGSQFAQTISGLKNEFHGLERTAANAALAPFNDMVREVTERMPFLNRSVNTFTNLLGSGSTNALTGIIDSLETMEPLLVSAGIWVDKLLSKFASVAAGGGLKEFTDYARSTLPLVTDTLENLVVAVVDLIRAFAPMGAGVLQVINDVSQVISGMPVGVLTALATGAAAGFLGFQAWRGITAIVNGVVGALTFMNNKMIVSATLARGLSLATAGVGVAIAAATFFYAKHAQAAAEEQQAVDALTDSLVASNQAIDENVQKTQFKTLQDQGAIDAANRLGISLKLVMDASLGQKDAAAEVARQMLAAAQAQDAFEQGGARTGRTSAETNSALTIMNQVLGNATGQYLEASGAAKDYLAATAKTTPVLDEATQALNRQGSAYGVTGDALKTFEGKQKDAAAASDEARAKMILESDAAGILRAELDKLNGEAISAAEAQNRFDSALANMSDHTTKTGKKIVLTTKNVNGMSAASVAIRGDLIGQVRAMEGVIEKNGGLSNSTDKAKASYRALYDQIVANAVAKGHDKKAVEAFLSTMVDLNNFKPNPTKLDVDTAAAKRKTTEFQAMINGLTGKTVMVSVYTTEHIQQLRDAGKVAQANASNTANQYATGKAYSSSGSYKPSHKDGLANANGNVFKAFANGGVESHIAQMAPAGAMRLWAEPETGGESYIPHAKSKRGRSRQIWEETGRILGVDKGSSSVQITHTGNIVANSPVDYQAEIEATARRNALVRF